jgi:HD-GYP domain-containing protein (c-di-GMP phosphodiesterase class II)
MQPADSGLRIRAVMPFHNSNNKKGMPMGELDLSALDRRLSLSEKVRILYGIVNTRFPFVEHISVAIYERETDYVRAFLDSNTDKPVLSHYRARLADAPGLKQILESGKPRVIEDLRPAGSNGKQHTLRLIAAGFRSSYTIPIFFNDVCYGFVFFNSRQTNQFTEAAVAHLDPLARLLAMFVVTELRSIYKLTAATKTVKHITARRDCETGAHLERMSRYARLIANDIANQHELTDEYIEHLFLFAPLHDIGKIAIPDSILLKPGRLSPDEFQFMKSHTTKGLDMIDYLLKAFDLQQMPYVEILRNIVLHHHEAVNGEGYPDGLRQDDIPIEARVVTTADIFDALTSRRPYKEAWTNEHAFDELEKLSGSKLDGNCVAALLRHRDELVELQHQYRESAYG